jgi:membrane protease YdiL (CAAX protease family)
VEPLSPPAAARPVPPAPTGPDPEPGRAPSSLEAPRLRWLALWFLVIGLPLQLLAGRAPLLTRLVAAQLSYALPAMLWAARSGFRPLRLLRVGPVPGSGLLLGAATGLAGILAGAGLQTLWRAALPGALVERFDVASQLVGQHWNPWLLLIAAALLPALCEELAFRGALQTGLMGRRSSFRAVWGSAVVFAAFHFDPVRFPPLLLLGLVFGWLTWRTGSIWPSAVAHAVNNGAAVLVLTLTSEAETADPTDTLPIPAAAALLVAGLGLLALLVGAARQRLPPAPDRSSFLVPGPARRGETTTGGAAPSP